MSQNELLPCPFCGPGASIVSLWHDDVAHRWRVGCGRCGCSTGIHPRDKTEAPAITAWNTRIEAAQAVAPGEGQVDLRKYRGVAEMAIDYASMVATPVDEDLARELLAIIDAAAPASEAVGLTAIGFRYRMKGHAEGYEVGDWHYNYHRAPDSFELRECEIEAVWAGNDATKPAASSAAGNDPAGTLAGEPRAATGTQRLAAVSGSSSEQEQAGELHDPEICPNCCSPWKCNGPHIGAAPGEDEYLAAGAPLAQKPMDKAANNAGVAAGSRNALPSESVTRGSLPLNFSDAEKWIENMASHPAWAGHCGDSHMPDNFRRVAALLRRAARVEVTDAMTLRACLAHSPGRSNVTAQDMIFMRAAITAALELRE